MVKKVSPRGTDFKSKAVVAKYDVSPIMHKELGRPALLKFIGDVDGERVLDLGCGNGEIAHELTKRGAKCVGIDHSSEFVKLASERYPGLKFLVADGTNLKSLKSGSFDKVIMSMVLLSVPERKAFLGLFKESSRLLKTGGELIFSTLHPLNMQKYKDRLREVMLPPDWNYFQSGRQFKARVTLTNYKQIEFIDTHWTLTDISEALGSNSFVIKEMLEPKISGRQKEKMMEDTLFVPYHLLFKAVKMAVKARR